MNKKSRADLRRIEEAKAWAIRKKSGLMSPEEREEFIRWCSQNHREFVKQYNLLTKQEELSGLRSVPYPQSPPATPNWRKVAIGMVVAAVIVFGIVAAISTPQPVSYTTRTGEMRALALADGSTIHLNTRTRLKYLDDSRRVELYEGEALFDVKPDPTRPFHVIVDSTEIRVLGTRFNVYRKGDGHVVLTVLDGLVEVRGPAQGNGQGWVRHVGAKEQIEYHSLGPISEPRQIDRPAWVTKWSTGSLAIPPGGLLLPELILELGRYTDEKIIIRDPRLSTVRFGGGLSTRNVPGTLRSMQKIAPLKVTEESSGKLTLDYREP